MHAICERITVAGPEIVGVRLTAAAHAHGLALALPEEVGMARQTGVEHGDTTIFVRVPIAPRRGGWHERRVLARRTLATSDSAPEGRPRPALNRSHRAMRADTAGRCRSRRPPILIGEQGCKGPSIAGDGSPEHRPNERVEQSADRAPWRRVLNLDREPRAVRDGLEPVAADHREQLIYAGRAAGWLVVPSLEPGSADQDGAPSAREM